MTRVNLYGRTVSITLIGDASPSPPRRFLIRFTSHCPTTPFAVPARNELPFPSAAKLLFRGFLKFLLSPSAIPQPSLLSLSPLTTFSFKTIHAPSIKFFARCLQFYIRFLLLVSESSDRVLLHC
ncbi:hypothetical protein K1719_013020 [Acacia pycnantha]|nr:hypothetical protein K1719_013020 [Acacia pycnantha]